MTYRKVSLLLLLTLPFFSCNSQNSDERKIENIMALARLYGYIRYFHPSDEAAKINWEKFSQFAAHAVKDAKNDEELLTTLKDLFYPIAPSIVLFGKNDKSIFNKQNLVPRDTTGYKTITWQYKGINLGNSPAYIHVRINRPNLQVKSGASFAPFSQSLKGPILAGKKIKLSAWMKVIPESNDGGGHLWIRVDKKTGMGFFDNMEGRAATDSVWKKYEIVGKIDDDANEIYFGGLLSGNGQLYIDDLTLMTEENGEWKPAQIQNGSFEDTSDHLPLRWQIQGVSGYEYEINHEAKFGKFCLKIATIHSELINLPAGAIFENYPPATELITKMISSTIGAIIPISLYGNQAGTYPVADTLKFTKLAKQIDAMNGQAAGDVLDVRLGDVIVAWNIFKHFFPYWEDASQNPDTILRNAVSKSFTDKTALDFKYTLRLMTAALNDGHIRVSLYNDTSELHTAPLLLEYVENELVVEKVLDKRLSNMINVGDVVTSIDGTETEKFLLEKEKLVSGSPQWKRYQGKIFILAGAQNSTVTLSTDRSKAIPLLRNFLTNSLYGEISQRRATGKIKEGIYYVDINATPMATIDSLLPDLQKAKAVIFDLRGYPRNNHEVINHLLKTSESDRWMFIPKIVYPDYQNVTYDSLGWNMQPESPHLNGKIIFITDGRAISYAESFMGYIKDLHLATIVGQPTAGTNGNVNPFSLPGGYRISWTGMLVKNHDGSKHHLKGIIPDIIVSRTIKGIREGRDELLEKAIEVAEAEK